MAAVFSFLLLALLSPLFHQPTEAFRSSQNTAWNGAWSRLASIRPDPDHRAGTSRGVQAFGGVGRSSGVYPTNGVSIVRSLQPRSGESSSRAAFTSGFTGPSSEPPSYEPGPSRTRTSQPRIEGPDLNNLPADHVCGQCGEEFMSVRALFVHKIVHHPEGDKVCDICNSPYATRNSLLAHIRKKHFEVADDIKAEEKKSAKFKCDDCGKLLKTKNSLSDHRKSHNTMDTYCGECDKILATRQGYRTHLKRRHPEISEAEADAAQKRYIDENPEKCELCPKRFKSDRGLWDHMPFHDGQTTCNECGAVLTSTSTLAAHKRKEHQLE